MSRKLIVAACAVVGVASMAGGAGAAGIATPTGGGKAQLTAQMSSARGPRGLRGPRGPKGPQGPIGQTGPQGSPGAPGSNAFGALTYVEGATGSIPKEEQRFVYAECPSGMHPVGGGVLSGDEQPGEDVNSSFPAKPNGEVGNLGWAVFVDNYSETTAETATAYAICAQAGSVTGP